MIYLLIHYNLYIFMYDHIKLIYIYLNFIERILNRRIHSELLIIIFFQKPLAFSK